MWLCNNAIWTDLPFLPHHHTDPGVERVRIRVRVRVRVRVRGGKGKVRVRCSTSVMSHAMRLP